MLGIQKEKFCGESLLEGNASQRKAGSRGEKNTKKSTLRLDPERCLSSGGHMYSENWGWKSAMRAAAERRPDNDMIDERRRARGSDRGGRAAPPIATHLLAHTVRSWLHLPDADVYAFMRRDGCIVCGDKPPGSSARSPYCRGVDNNDLMTVWEESSMKEGTAGEWRKGRKDRMGGGTVRCWNDSWFLILSAVHSKNTKWNPSQYLRWAKSSLPHTHTHTHTHTLRLLRWAWHIYTFLDIWLKCDRLSVMLNRTLLDTSAPVIK